MPQTLGKGGDGAIFIIFFLFFLTVRLTEPKQTAFRQALPCAWLKAEPGRDFFPVFPFFRLGWEARKEQGSRWGEHQPLCKS